MSHRGIVIENDSPSELKIGSDSEPQTRVENVISTVFENFSEEVKKNEKRTLFIYHIL